MSTATVAEPAGGTDAGGWVWTKLFARGPETVRTDGVSLAMSAAVLTAVGYAGVMVTIARDGGGLAWLSVPLAVGAYFLTEKTHRFGFTPLAANLVSLPLLLFVTRGLFEGGVGQRLVGGADLLVFLTWVMLFQWKEPRHYLWLCALAVLQAAVGAVLTTEFAFGATIPGLLFLTIRAVMHIVASQSTRGEPPRRGPAPGRAEAETDVAAALVRPSVIATDPGLSASDFPRHGRAFGRAAAIVSCGAAAAAMLLFGLTPRWWVERVGIEERAAAQLGFDEPRPGGGGGGPAVTGYSDSVTLGSMSEALASAAPVFDLQIVDDQGETVPVEEYARRLGYAEPLFRGGVLNRYDEGDWTLAVPPESEGSGLTLPERPQRGVEYAYVRQKIRMKSDGARTLFTIDPLVAVTLDRPVEGPRLSYQPSTRTIRYYYTGTPATETTRWTVYSPASNDLAEVTRRSPPGVLPRLTRMLERLQCLTLPERGAERLRERAIEVGVEDDDLPEPAVVAERLLRHLTDSGEYSYALDAHVVPDGVDPVEEFLFERKTGHCEYFASALALMLRANGIPARIVNGYKGGEVNSLTGLFEVEQRHAHAWVEAEIDGTWRTLDPTPSAERTASVAANGDRFKFLADAVAAASDFWQQYFVLLNLRTQQETFFEPLAEAADAAGAKIEELRESEETASAIGFFAALGRPTEWFAWKGGVIGYGMLLVLAAVIVAVIRVRRGDLDAAGRRGFAGASEIAFFERYREICRGAGLRRPAPATDREFGGVVAGAVPADRGPGEASGAIGRLVAAFYDARFGGKPLAADRLAGLEEDLRRVDAGLEPRTNGATR